MKKISFSLIFLLALISVFSCFTPAFAIEADGRYELPIVLWHAEEDKVSFGNSYMFPTALLEKSNDKTTITIATNDNVRNFKVWYYTDGSVSGNTNEAEKLSNVQINGKVHSEAFRFEIVEGNEFVGVKFRASIMPMTPSARLKIDYANAVPANMELTPPEPTENVSEKLSITETTPSTVVNETTTEIIESTSEHTTTEEDSEAETQEPSTEEQDNIEGEQNSPSTIKYLMFSAIGIAIIYWLNSIICYNKQEKVKIVLKIDFLI